MTAAGGCGLEVCVCGREGEREGERQREREREEGKEEREREREREERRGSPEPASCFHISNSAKLQPARSRSMS